MDCMILRHYLRLYIYKQSDFKPLTNGAESLGKPLTNSVIWLSRYLYIL